MKLRCAMREKGKGNMHPLVGVIMGFVSDWETMQHAVETLERLPLAAPTRVYLDKTSL